MTGIFAVAAIVECIREEDESAVADYREAPALGDSEYSLDVLQATGADVTEPEPIKDAILVCAEFLDETAVLPDLK